MLAVFWDAWEWRAPEGIAMACLRGDWRWMGSAGGIGNGLLPRAVAMRARGELAMGSLRGHCNGVPAGGLAMDGVAGGNWQWLASEGSGNARSRGTGNGLLPRALSMRAPGGGMACIDTPLLEATRGGLQSAALAPPALSNSPRCPRYGHSRRSPTEGAPQSWLGRHSGALWVR